MLFVTFVKTITATSTCSSHCGQTKAFFFQSSVAHRNGAESVSYFLGLFGKPTAVASGTIFGQTATTSAGGLFGQTTSSSDLFGTQSSSKSTFTAL